MHAILLALVPNLPAGETEMLIVRTVENEQTESVMTPVRTETMKTRVGTGGMTVSVMSASLRERQEREVETIGNLLLTGGGPLQRNEKLVTSGAPDETDAQTMHEIVMTERIESERRKRSLRGWKLTCRVSLCLVYSAA